MTKFYNPIRNDLPKIHADFPAAMCSLTIESHGAKLNGMIYLAAGKGPHPTVILLHGFPGNERNLDIAQAIRRAGWNVVNFNYRGSWGSEGEYSQQHLVEDTLVIFHFLRLHAEKYRTNAKKIVLIGHSMGGATALAAAIEEPKIKFIVSLAGVNWDVWAAHRDEHPAQFNELATQLDGDSAPLTGFDGKAFLTEVSQNYERYGLQSNAKKLSKRQILLVGGNQDRTIPLKEHHFPMSQILAAKNPSGVSAHILDDDHVFSNTRIALTEIILFWLGKLDG